MSKKKILVTGATGDTGGEAVNILLERGHQVRALVHRFDDRSKELEKKGAEVVKGDYLNLDEIRSALKSVEGAYFVYPIRPGIIQASAYFAQASKEAGVGIIVNMSQISSRKDSKSHAARDHWIAEQVFSWSGVPVTHIRPTFFAEWLLYLAPMIAQGKYSIPLAGRHAPVAAEDQARVIVGILENPKEHAGKVYPLFGPVELSQEEIAGEVGKALGKTIKYEYVDFDSYASNLRSVTSAKESHNAKNMYGEGSSSDGKEIFLFQHLREVMQDHTNGLFAGTNQIVETVGGKRPLTVAEFVNKHKEAFV